jgi:hypothetical protein
MDHAYVEVGITMRNDRLIDRFTPKKTDQYQIDDGDDDEKERRSRRRRRNRIYACVLHVDGMMNLVMRVSIPRGNYC